jgi:hypothetical protein
MRSVHANDDGISCTSGDGGLSDSLCRPETESYVELIGSRALTRTCHTAPAQYQGE